MEVIYVPPQNHPSIPTTIGLEHALENYIYTEFPSLFKELPSSYMVPEILEKRQSQVSVMPSNMVELVDPTRLQADMAEELIFNSLKCMEIPGIVFHGRTYINNSKGKKTFKEHDFVILTQRRICFIEVKSCADVPGQSVKVLSDGKSIRDNRRSGMHQLKAHVTLLHEKFGIESNSIGQILAWPFLSNTDSRGQQRFTQDSESELKHFFSNLCQDKDLFFSELSGYLQNLQQHEVKIWESVLQWFTLLACGAVVDNLVGEMDSQLILLSQEQLSITCGDANQFEEPVIIYGPPGSGKTLLILIKINELWQENCISSEDPCLLLTGRHGNGLAVVVRKYLQKKGIQNVTVKSLPSSHESFQDWCVKETDKFTHVFIDGVEDLAWYGNISKNKEFIKQIRSAAKNGYFWCMLDGSQLVYNLAIQGGPEAASQLIPQTSLTKEFRTTENIFLFTKSCISDSKVDDKYHGSLASEQVTFPLEEISLAHNIKGPPVQFVNYDNFVSREETICMLIVDLCGYKGIKPNDLVLLTSSSILQGRLNITAINHGLQKYFDNKGFIPKGVVGVSRFLNDEREEHFCVSSVSGYKGLEAKVIIILPILFRNSSKEMIRRMLYSMASRCLSLLVVVWSGADSNDVIDVTSLSQFTFASSDCPLKEFFRKTDDDNKEETERLKKEKERLKTFEAYPVSANVKPAELAKNGFIFRGGNTDHVMCVYCGGVLYDWEPNDVPDKEHRKFYGNCPFILGEDVGNVPIRAENVD